jgi:hypothetical protein
VLDVSQTAIDVTKKRLVEAARQVNWIAGDVNEVPLDVDAYDVWHDRAVLHFLTDRPEGPSDYKQKSCHDALFPEWRKSMKNMLELALEANAEGWT